MIDIAVDNQPWFKIRQATSSDRWTLAPKWEIILLLTIILLSAPFCLALLSAAFRSNSIFGFLLIIGIVFVLIPLPAYRIISIFFYRKWSCYWIAEGDDRVVAIAKISRHKQSIILDRIRVKSKYRRQAIGSTLVQQLLEAEGKVAYGYVPAKALNFFKSIGFRQIPKKQVPDTLKFEINKFDLGDFFYIVYGSPESDISSAQEEYIVSNIEKSYRARPAKVEDIPKIRTLISLSFDIFLPFGFSTTTFRVLCFKAYSISFLVILFLGLFDINFRSALLYIWVLSLSFVFFILPIILFFTIYVKPQDINQFWLLECHNEIIGYARIKKYPAAQIAHSYTIIQHLFITELHRHPSVEQVLVERIVKYGRGNFYIAATSERADWLKRLGFEPIRPQEFPPAYQFGANISALLKSNNLVFSRA